MQSEIFLADERKRCRQAQMFHVSYKAPDIEADDDKPGVNIEDFEFQLSVNLFSHVSYLNCRPLCRVEFLASSSRVKHSARATPWCLTVISLVA